MSSANRWSVYTYSERGDTAKKRKTCRLLKDADAIGTTYLHCSDVDAVLIFDEKNKRLKDTYGCFPTEKIIEIKEELVK